MQGFRQPADVVMRLDGMGFLGFCRRTFDHIGINGALRQPLCRWQLRGFALENLHEYATDDFAFFLGVGHALELAQEFFARIDMNDLHVHVLAEHLHHLPALVEPQQAGIDENTGELVANRFLDERSGDARIDTSA